MYNADWSEYSWSGCATVQWSEGDVKAEHFARVRRVMSLTLRAFWGVGNSRTGHPASHRGRPCKMRAAV